MAENDSMSFQPAPLPTQDAERVGVEVPTPPIEDGDDRVLFRIRTRLALLALALALPFAGYSAFSAIAEARIEREHAGIQMLATAQVTAARLDDHVNDIRSVLMVLTSIVSVDPDKTAENDAVLRKLQGHIPEHINNLTVWSATGENIGSLSPQLRRNGGTNAAGRPFFRDALLLAGTGMSVEAPVVSLSDGSRISVFGLPIWRDGRVVGVVGAATRLGALQELLTAGAHLPESAIMTITDAGGVVLARSIDPQHWVGRTIKSVAGLPDGARDGQSADGIERIAGLTTARAAPWRVYVGIPKDVALAPVYARLRGSLLIASSALLIGLLLAGLMGESIASPLRQLNQDAAEFGGGNLTHRSRTRGKGEVGVLARTMNRMAAQLQERAEALAASQERLRQVTDNLPALISYIDPDERFRFANQVYRQWLGIEPEALLGRTLSEVYGEDVYDLFKAHIHRGLSGERVTYERRLDALQGPRYAEVVVVPDVDQSGQVLGLFVMMSDITARRDAEAALQQSERRLQTVANNIPAMVTYVDREERYRFVNAYLGRVFHTEPSSLLGKTLREAGGSRLYEEMKPHSAAALSGEEVMFQGVWSIQDRTYHYQSTYIPDIDAQGTVQGYYAMTFDISALKETQRRLDELARVDTLTGLPNRRQFDERLLEAMARTRRSETTLAVMFLDIDFFKRINDSFGHGAGDAVLKEFGTRLQHQIRSTDIVARLAGDEFVVLAEGILDVRELRALAGKIVDAVRPPLFVTGRTISITTSVGISTYDGDGQTPAELMAAADKALYAAKRRGRDRFALATQAVAEVHEWPPACGRTAAS